MIKIQNNNNFQYKINRKIFFKKINYNNNFNKNKEADQFKTQIAVLNNMISLIKKIKVI